jgi:hypothetical protein
VSSEPGAGQFPVVKAEGGSGVKAEIKFREIAVKVLLFAVLVRAAHTAFEHAEIGFHGVRRHVAPRVFLGAVIDGFV